ncbi:MAG: DUF4384 domain-containing protein [Pyrinomonadaceae bacterium]
MKTILLALSLLMIGMSAFAVSVPIAQEQEDVRGAFLTTRPKPVDKSNSPSGATARPSRRRPKTTQARTPSTTTSATTGDTTAGTTTAGAKDAGASPKTRAQKIGLGMTLFTRDSHGLAVRVDPTRVFRSGDRVRVLLETNTDGYLYIFNTTDGGKPVMIYPSSELDEGGNYIQSHVPFEIPSSVGQEERLRWLTFDKYAGAERLIFVFTREPLPAVPTEDDLISYCKRNENKCPIEPAAEQWAKIQTELSMPLQVAKAQEYGTAQTAGERDASARGLGLSKDDPEPSMVMMTASANTGMLVTVLELIHK